MNKLPVPSVIALHDRNQAMTCNRIHVMTKGSLLVVGTPAEILTLDLIRDVLASRLVLSKTRTAHAWCGSKPFNEVFDAISNHCRSAGFFAYRNHAETFEVKMLNGNAAGGMALELYFLTLKPGDTVKFLATQRGA